MHLGQMLVALATAVPKWQLRASYTWSEWEGGLSGTANCDYCGHVALLIVAKWYCLLLLCHCDTGIDAAIRPQMQVKVFDSIL